MMSLDVQAMTEYHERVMEEQASDAVRRLAPTPHLTPLADHARDKYLLAKANQQIAEHNYRIEHLLSVINTLEGGDMATTRQRHLGRP